MQPPSVLKENLIKAFDDGHNQYTRSFGHPLLVEKIAKIYGKKLGREIDPLNEILITPGANGSLNAFINAYVNKGDQIVSFEPMFQMYLDHCEFAGGIMKTVQLRLTEGVWTFDPQELRQAIASGNTKILLLNSPHNPTGKVFTLEEYKIITEIL